VTELANEQETLEWGRALGASAGAGDVIALCGNLGAGKTHATKGIVAGLGSKAEVTSPTFTLVHEYGGGWLPVFHFDFYRADSEADVLSVGWDEFFCEEGVMIVEWADRFPLLLPPETGWYTLRFRDGGGRIVEAGRVES
jgi:tRNA threonylcarbamoyladenosine biosynthesis protein TsaE